MAELHSALDFARDVLVAVIAGLLLFAVSGWLAHRRSVRKRFDQNEKRLARHAHEIRHTQEAAEIKPLYPEYPADKL